MKTFIKIISNEFKAIGTNIPILIVLVLGNVGYGFLYNLLYNTNVYKEAPIAIVDMSQSDLSQHFIDYIDATREVKVVAKTQNFHEAKRMLIEREIIGFLYIPSELKDEIIDDSALHVFRKHFKKYSKRDDRRSPERCRMRNLHLRAKHRNKTDSSGKTKE